MKKIVYGTPNATPLSPALRSGNTIYISGQVPRDDKGQIPQGIEAQTRMVLDKITALLGEAGATLADVVKATVFLTNKDDFAGMNRVYAKYFPTQPPARSTIHCGLMIPILVEIECIAAVG